MHCMDVKFKKLAIYVILINIIMNNGRTKK